MKLKVRNFYKKNNIIIGASCVFAIISIVWSINMISGASQTRTYQTRALSSLFNAFIVFVLCIISLISSGAAFYISKKAKDKNRIAISIFCIIFSFLPVITYPISDQMARESANKAEQAMQEKEAAKQATKEAYETEPSIINQMISYTDCFSYKESAKYRGARDAICGYLRYAYSNDWQEPLTGEQLIDSGYVPSYFKELSSEKSVGPVVINNQAYEIEISRDNIGESYLITPHQSCSKEKNDGLISVWYTDYSLYENGQDPQELICMYYDYHEDANYAKLNKYEDTSFNIYSSDFKDFYEKLLQMLYDSKNNPSYQFSVPYHGVFLYNNAEFMNSFFSAWPEDYFTY